MEFNRNVFLPRSVFITFLSDINSYTNVFIRVIKYKIFGNRRQQSIFAEKIKSSTSEFTRENQILRIFNFSSTTIRNLLFSTINNATAASLCRKIPIFISVKSRKRTKIETWDQNIPVLFCSTLPLGRMSKHRLDKPDVEIFLG